MKTNRRSKRQDTPSKMILEEIIGLTTKNANGLASNTSTACCAYVAGCVVVVYDVDSGKQSHLMVSHRTPKPLSCVAVSRDGHFIAAGEAGNQPAVLVWDCSTMALVSELKDHLYGVECIALSPDGEHLVSVGGYIYFWNWRSGLLVTKLKASSSCSAVTSVSFSADAKFVITAGKKHLKFWTVGSSLGTRLKKGTLSLTMHGKPVNLGLQKGSSFTSVTSAILTNSCLVNSGQVGDLFPIYALTTEGVLCIVDYGLSVTKSVDLKVEKGFALSASDKLIACACSNGIVQLFTSETLSYTGSLLYSKAKSCLGETNSAYNPTATGKEFQSVSALPDAVACQFSTSEKLVVVYGDHTLCIWDIHDINQATKQCVLVSHSACIWDVKNLCCENMHDPSLACVARGCSGGVSFATCSADGTIRLWDLALQPDLVDGDTNHLLNTESGITSRLVSAGIFERDTMETSLSTQGFRSMAASSDGKYLAAGDCEGNLHIYDLKTSNYTCFQGAHDAEILSLSFSLCSNTSCISEGVPDGNYFLASGGRDRIIHLYDVKRNFNIIESIYDHSAAVTSVKLTSHDCKILSCSADRSLVSRDVSVTDSGHKISRRHHQIASNGTVYDMAIDPTMEFVVTVGQDKKINTFNIASGKLIRSFKPDIDFGDPIKVTMDPSCSYLVCSYSNKSMCMYDSISGEMVVQVMGHGEVVTGVIFLPDCKHVVSVACDGCIFIWKLPTRISSTILQRMKENSALLTSKNFVLPTAFNRNIFSKKEDHQDIINHEDVLLPESNQFAQNGLDRGEPRRISTFRFSISRLPMWAQSKVAHSNIVIDRDFMSSQQEQREEYKIFSPVFSGDWEYGSFFREAQTPLSLNAQGKASCLTRLSRSSPETFNNQTSPMSEEALRCFSRDKHWLNVYTVCLDLLNSPEAKLITVSGDMAAQQSLHKSRSQMQKAGEVDYCSMKCKENDIFKRHFCSLSTRCKMERSKLSAGRRFSARYVVRQDSTKDHWRLFGTPGHEEGKTLKYGAETTSCITSADAVNQNLEEVPETNSCEQEEKKSIEMSSHGLSTKYSLAENSNRLKEAAKQKGSLTEEENLQQRMIECGKALLQLDAATQNVLNLFTELGTQVSKEEISNDSGAKLYDEAGKLLPSIAEKLDAVAQLVQCRIKYSSRKKVDVSDFVPLLETFAENLSERVLEMVKKNLNKD